ncbi:MAG: cytochrome-c peroxidase [Chitinophagia bacterium]|nr:cytochrome-c peroxidase [Chitinophagia bacterium]
MKKTYFLLLSVISFVIVLVSCSKRDSVAVSNTKTTTVSDPFAAIKSNFGTEINPLSWINYAGQTHPAYILKDNGINNPIVNGKATLGRVLFYDKSLSVTNTVACASCHKQEFAFSDTLQASLGVLGGTTDRHAMRLINTRFAEEVHFFWDERALTLEAQTTQPIVAHNEMGYSGQSGRDNLSGLLAKLQAIDYYKELFTAVYGDANVTENRLQECLAQFIRSIQSFDSKYDSGRIQVNNDRTNFPNFTTEENTGKSLFMTPPIFDANSIRIAGGLGCNTCHQAPEFDIAPNSRNNGVIATISGANVDISVTRAPSLRDVVNAKGDPNGPLMHSGVIKNLGTVIAHYAAGIVNNANLDGKLKPNGRNVQQLNLQPGESAAIIAFMKTLTGKNVYTDKKWSSPFKQ